MNEQSPIASVPNLNQGSGLHQDASGYSALTEDLALALLKHRDLEPGSIEHIANHREVMKCSKVRLRLAAHARAPRRIALRLIREFYLFELMQFALMPLAPADLRRIADELLLSRLSSITLGERMALARRCSERVAGALLLDRETLVWQAALTNPRLTERAIVKAVQRTKASPGLVECLSQHAKWSPRPDVRLALLRSAHTPFARAIEFARRLPASQLRDVLHSSRLPEKTKAYLTAILESSSQKADPK